MTTLRTRLLQRAATALLLVAAVAFASPALADPPDRVARLSYLRGAVSFQPAGDDGWAEATLNRPLVTGDRLFTDRDSRAELQLGAATLRADQMTTLDLLNLTSDFAQVELSAGVLSLRVRRLRTGENYEVDTPTLAFVASQPGDYRIDIAPDGSSTMVTVFSGSAVIYGRNNASYTVQRGNSYRFHDSDLRDYEIMDLPRADDFDRWVESRVARSERSTSLQYVSDEVIGYSDLDDYGTWSTVAEYGAVWYPTRVSVGWVPYRSGHWSWIDPWGWTWVDSAPWGFAPFHYGRWAYINSRWGWVPGPRHVRPIYAPALVAFAGGSGWSVSISSGPVGWFPLGPRDVYVPWYQTSRSYFTNVNVHNTVVINNVHITNVYNNYSRGRPITGVSYAYRNNASAWTAVPRETFVRSRPVAQSVTRVSPAQMRAAQVSSRVAIAPSRESIVAGNRRAAAPRQAVLERDIIARTAPPPRPAPIASRLQAIERNNAQPLQREQLREIATRERPAAGAAGSAARPRVQVVGDRAAATPRPLPQRASRPGAADTEGAGRSARQAPAERATGSRATPAARPGGPAAESVRSGADSTAPVRPAPAQRPTPTRPAAGEREQRALPSSRFAPGRESGDNTPATPQRRSPAAPERSTPPASRAAPATRPAPTATPRATGGERATPSSRFVPRHSGGAPAPAQRQATPQARSAPAPVQRQPAPQPRSAPAPAQRQAAPQPRSAPAPVQRQSAPQPRSAPAPVQRQPAPQPRSAPAPVQRQPAPQPRSAPTPVQRQPAPQPRSAPAPVQRQPAPQPRSAPAPVQRQPAPQPRSAPAPAPRSAPQQRSAPAPARRARPADREGDRR